VTEELANDGTGAGEVKLSDEPIAFCGGVVSGAVGVTAVITRGCDAGEVGIDCLAGTTV